MAGGLAVVAALAALMLYMTLQSQIADASYEAKQASDQAADAQSELQALRSEVDDLASRTDDIESRADDLERAPSGYQYGYGY